MINFVWHEDYDVGNEELNTGHKEILVIMKRIYLAYEKGCDKGIMLKLLKELEVMAIKHFKEEEEHMKNMNYPSLIHHRHLHGEMINQLKDYSKALNNWDAEFTEFFFEFLRIWIVEHILHIDKDYYFYEKLKHGVADQACSSSRQYSS